MNLIKNNKKFIILTYGCQMNVYDSERMEKILTKIDYTPTNKLIEADLILLNTCSVREKAEQKVFSKLGRLKDLKIKNPQLKIGLCGCIPQLHGEKLFEKIPYIDLLIGTDSINNLAILLKDVENDKKKVIDIDDAKINNEDSEQKKILLPDKLKKNKIQAFVSVMKGCSNFCSYCIVPYVRGKEKSRRSKEILDEIIALVASGCKEVTLLGQNVNSYGKDILHEIDFSDLLGSINKVEGLKRIRFVTSHPKDMSNKLIASMANLEKVCEHLHLPLQSGSNNILKMMNRGYTVEEYLDKVDLMKSTIPNIQFSTDIIVGFPGETEKDFEKTLDIVEKIKFRHIYLFKYSPRPETKAFFAKNRVSGEKVRGRFDRLFNIQRQIMMKENHMMEGKVEEVLIEGMSKKDKNKLTGRTRTNNIINFYSKNKNFGELINLLITKGSLYSLGGEVV